MTDSSIQLSGVKTHNLKNINAAFPLGDISVVTGVSGSGKSSLVFDTLYGEAYRRYLESLSSFARQYMKALPKPEVRAVKNLPPAIAVKQLRSKATSRSTVGTITELIDLLRIIYTHGSQVTCVSCNREVDQDTPVSILKKAYAQYKRDTTLLILAPLTRFSNLAAKDLKAYLIEQGFKRAFHNDEVVKIADLSRITKQSYVVIDRLSLKPDQRGRLEESLTLAYKLSQGSAAIVEHKTKDITHFSQELRCLPCDEVYEKATSSRLSFNHPLGACETCNGFGLAAVLDEEKILPDRTKSINTKGVAPWNFGKHTMYYRHVKQCAKEAKIDPDKPFEKYTKKQLQWLFEGSEAFEGIAGYFAWLDSKRYKPHYRIHAARYRKYIRCPDCHGSRLKAKALAYKLNGRDIHELCNMSLKVLAQFIQDLDKESLLNHSTEKAAKAMGIKEALEEVLARLSYLEKVGLNYLTLDRTTRTLSGGEFQRINMARCLGNALTDSLFCLDEPSCGLHPRDSRNLMEIISELRDQGNTIVVVEHEHQIIKAADHVIEVGPQAGHLGGNITYDGKGKTYKPHHQVSFDYSQREVSDKSLVQVKGAKTHNLKNITVKFPVGRLTGICGVSGSGKTSLVEHTIYPLVANGIGQSDGHKVDGAVTPSRLIKGFDQVMLVSQASLGRSSRSNIATYLGVYDEIRKLMADTPVAKAKKIPAGYFSFNVSGGRCENCKGLGTIVEDLSFLGEMNIVCPECEGRRFKEDLLEVHHNGKNINDILRLTVMEAREFFYNNSRISKILDAVIKIGLGYLTLGQKTSSFSGGEAQRLKLVSLIKDADKGAASLLIFDEPSTGLSDADVYQLLEQLRFLTELGHTVLVIEHHVGFLKSCDWLIEVGPEAGDAGGELVYEGAPRKLKSAKRSRTAPFLTSQT